MLFGAHVSAAGGLLNAPRNAVALEAETFQFFSRPPQGGPAPRIDKNLARDFRNICEKSRLSRFAIHAPYYINFASPNSRIRQTSIRVIREELERGSALGAEFMMTHLGSGREIKNKNAILKTVAASLIDVLSGYRGTTRFLVEISAGSGQTIGAEFEEIAGLLAVIDQKNKSVPIGVCFDTQHDFASGYDLSTLTAVKTTLAQIDSTIGLERIFMSHANDSKTELNSRKDRHEHLGQGRIGIEGFKALVNHPKLQHWLFVVETPNDQTKRREDIKLLKKLRAKTA